MNLLIDNWIPVRPRNGGKVQIINLQSLYCSRDQWRLSLPRDDMETGRFSTAGLHWANYRPGKR